MRNCAIIGPAAHQSREMGLIVRLVRDRGFGFIRTTAGGHWLFWAGDTVESPFERLSEGQTVTFEVQDQRAVKVQPA